MAEQNVETADQKTVLIADDERGLRILIRATLKSSGYRLIEAENGVDALDSARRERPHLLLLDIGMPGMDGYQVCEALKNDPTTNDITVVMFTARAQPADLERGLQAGADAYFTKPLSPLELRINVQQLLSA